MTSPALLGGVFVLGLMTAVSPCPLTTNVAAISFLSRGVGSPRRVLLSALLYVLGLTITYVGLGAALLWAFRAAAAAGEGLDEFASPASRLIQRYMGLALGPVLMLVGMVLLGLIKPKFWIGVGGSAGGKTLQDRVAAGGAIWALPLGMLLALAFCPSTAALFLAAMTVSLEHGSTILPPLVYGLGTAVPVVGLAMVIAFAGRYLSKAFGAVAALERWLRLGAGVIFTCAGVYYCLTHIYGLRLLY